MPYIKLGKNIRFEKQETFNWIFKNGGDKMDFKKEAIEYNKYQVDELLNFVNTQFGETHWDKLSNAFLYWSNQLNLLDYEIAIRLHLVISKDEKYKNCNAILNTHLETIEWLDFDLLNLFSKFLI